MNRDQARTDYRRILAGVVRHHQALDRHVAGAAMARVAKRLGLRLRSGFIDAGDDKMALVSDLAIYGRVAGSTRAIDVFDRELVEALSRSWISIVRFTSRHPMAGWYVDDLLLERAGLWLMNEALEQSAREGMSLGTRLFEVGGFVLSTGAAAALTDAWMDALRNDLWTRRKPGALTDAEVVTLYRLTLSLGSVARHRNALEGPA
jgi:hypothetical protein